MAATMMMTTNFSCPLSTLSIKPFQFPRPSRKYLRVPESGPHRELDHPLEIEGVSGISSHSMEGHHPAFGRVIYNPAMRFNTMSMSVMRAC
jgi:hypothetical protein